MLTRFGAHTQPPTHIPSTAALSPRRVPHRGACVHYRHDKAGSPRGWGANCRTTVILCPNNVRLPRMRCSASGSDAAGPGLPSGARGLRCKRCYRSICSRPAGCCTALALAAPGVRRRQFPLETGGTCGFGMNKCGLIVWVAAARSALSWDRRAWGSRPAAVRETVLKEPARTGNTQTCKIHPLVREES